MNDLSTADLALLFPELILVGTALALLLTARRIRTSKLAAIATLLAALAAALTSFGFLRWAPQTAFGGMIIFDRYACLA